MTKEQKKVYRKKYYEANKKRILERQKLYQQTSAKSKETKRLYREKNKAKLQEYMKDYHSRYYDENKETILRNNKEWRESNPDYSKNHYTLNKEIYKNNHKNYRENNIEYFKTYRKKYEIERIANDPLYKFKARTRCLINNSLKKMNLKKTSKSYQILGCSYDEFKHHIESQFESWMSWGNYGNPKDGIFELNKTWDIDHIIPLNTAKTEEDVIRLNHYTNLRPLCSYYNRWIKKNYTDYL